MRRSCIYVSEHKIYLLFHLHYKTKISFIRDQFIDLNTNDHNLFKLQKNVLFQDAEVSYF